MVNRDAKVAAMDKTIAILGGTGRLGGALALRWARAGLPVIIGSRDPARAEATARAIAAAAPQASITGAGLLAAAQAGAIVVLAVPYSVHQPTLEGLVATVQGKILIDVTVPVMLPRVARVQLPPEGSVAVAAQALLGPEVRVVAAFQTVPASLLANPTAPIDTDILVCGNDRDARETVIGLARAAGLSALHGGALANAAAAEALAIVQIFLNGRYRATSSGIRFTGLDRDAPGNSLGG